MRDEEELPLHAECQRRSILIADGLDDRRVVILSRDMNYIGEFGGQGKGPGSSTACAIAIGPEGRVLALDRSGGRINIFRTTADHAKFNFVVAFAGFSLPLDIIVNDDCIRVTDLAPLHFNKLDFKGNHLYTWMVPGELPDGYIRTQTGCRSEAADRRAMACQIENPNARRLLQRRRV